jgi:hypothetical protein
VLLSDCVWDDGTMKPRMAEAVYPSVCHDVTTM